MASVPSTAETRQGRREERKAENREKLLAAARKVFAEKGVGAATARDIVRETDLASGTFYNYFRDKDEVFRALVEELTEKARAAVRAQRKQPGRTLEERIEGAYRAYFQLVLEERELFIMLRRNAGVISQSGTQNLLESGIGDLVEDMAEWEEAGDLPRVDLDYLATAMVGAAFYIAGHLVERQPPDVEAATSFCARLFVGGIRAVSPPAETG
ncbi:MAG TPA: TetR/AcrR family transcriptional regulator [Thermoleophilaceae bacterium]